MARFKFFNGPHKGETHSGSIIKDGNWMLETADGTRIDLEFGVRMARRWVDLRIVSYTEDEVVFAPVVRRWWCKRWTKMGKPFSKKMEELR